MYAKMRVNLLRGHVEEKPEKPTKKAENIPEEEKAENPTKKADDSPEDERTDKPADQ